MSYRFGLSDSETHRFFELQKRYRAQFVHEKLVEHAKEGDVDIDAISQEQFDALVDEYDEMRDADERESEDAEYVVSRFLERFSRPLEDFPCDR